MTKDEHRSARGLTDAELVAYMRCNPCPFPADDDAADRLEELAARVRELEGRTCDRCEHQEFRHNWGDESDLTPCCTLTRHTDDYGTDLMFECPVFGNTCGAFKEKPDDKVE